MYKSNLPIMGCNFINNKHVTIPTFCNSHQKFPGETEI